MKIERQKRNTQWEWESFLDDMTPDEEIEHREKTISEIKQRYQDDIFSQYSQTDQLNMTARVTEINTLCMLEWRAPTSEELIEINKAQLMIKWIRQKRADCATSIIKAF